MPAILVAVGPGNPLGLAQEVKDLPPLRGHTGAVWSVAFGPDGKTLASGGADGAVQLWDVAAGKSVRTLRGPEGVEVLSVAFRPDGKVVAAGGDDAVIRLWDMESGRGGPSLAGHTAEVRSLAYSPGGRLLASASRDQTVKLWDAATGKLTRTLDGHKERVDAVAFRPDGKALASAGAGGEVGAGGGGGTVRVWDPATGRNTATLEAKDSMLCVAFSPDGKAVAAGGWVSRLRVWTPTGDAPPRLLEGHTGQVWAVTFSPDGRWLASAGEDAESGTVRIWDAATGKAVRVMKGPVARAVAFSPDGEILAAAGEDGVVRLWRVLGKGK